MNAPQIHPEDLLDRARAGSLAPDEQRLLRRHLARCATCRFELSLAPALFAQMDLDDADEALVTRAIGRTRPARRYAWRRIGRNAARAAIVSAATVAFAAMASAGAYVWHRRAVVRLEAPELVEGNHRSSPVLPRDGRVDARLGAPRAAETSQPPAASPSMPEAPLPAVAPVARARIAPEAAKRAEDLRAAEASRATANACADRYRRANEARRDGAAEEAVRLYQELRPTCAGTSEELSSRVLGGRIYLDRLGDPARALAAFDSYLAVTSSGALREDAMIGRALALGRLNRAADEASAWQALLSSYPDSLYADKARSRLSRGEVKR
jgi:hypothetical protein